MSAPCPGSNGIREWLARPSHATGWWSKGAFQFYGIVVFIAAGLWMLFR